MLPTRLEQDFSSRLHSMNFPPPSNADSGPAQMPNQYAPTSTPAPSTRKTGWVLALLAVFGGGGIFVCCGGGGTVIYLGMGLVAAEVRDELSATPEFRENIGKIESFDTNFVRSGRAEDDETFVYDVAGSEGKGYVSVKQRTGPDGNEILEWAELTMEDGRRIPIDLQR